MYQSQLNHDEALRKLQHLRHEARIHDMLRRSREQADAGPALRHAGFVSRVGTLSRRVLQVLHLGPA